MAWNRPRVEITHSHQQVKDDVTMSLPAGSMMVAVSLCSWLLNRGTVITWSERVDDNRRLNSAVLQDLSEGWTDSRADVNLSTVVPENVILLSTDRLSDRGLYVCTLHQLSWVEQSLTSTTHSLGHFRDDVLQVWWPNQQCQSTEGGWLVIQTGLNLTMLTSPSYNNTTCKCRYNTRK